MTSLEEKAQRLMDAQGYFIVAFKGEPDAVPQPGHVSTKPVSSVTYEHQIQPPFLCIGHASKEEYLGQAAILETDEDLMFYVREDADRSVAFLKLVAE